MLKDKQTRKSKGVAFILFLKREDAQKCVSEINMKEVLVKKKIVELLMIVL